MVNKAMANQEKDKLLELLIYRRTQEILETNLEIM
mgnify:CR=1 FL=1